MYALQKRRIKVAPKYIAVSIHEDDQIVMPTKVADNEKILLSQRKPKPIRASKPVSKISVAPAKKLGFPKSFHELILPKISFLAEGLEPGHRRVIAFDRVYDDGAVNLILDNGLCRVSMIKGINCQTYITFDDICRLIEFIALDTLDELEDKYRRKLRSLLEASWNMQKIDKSSDLFEQVVRYRVDPKPVSRRSPFWVVSWASLDSLLQNLFRKDGFAVALI